jgi:hypothetical protein
MALLSGTAAEIALDLLRSGRAFQKDGAKTFERALKATQRGQVPEGAVSEFRKLIDGLEAEAIQRRLGFAGRVTTRKLPPWSAMRMESSYIPRSVDYWTNFASGYDQRAVQNFRRQAAEADQTARNYPELVGRRRALQRDASETRTTATIIEALVRLFGEKGPV